MKIKTLKKKEKDRLIELQKKNCPNQKLITNSYGLGFPFMPPSLTSMQISVRVPIFRSGEEAQTERHQGLKCTCHLSSVYNTSPISRYNPVLLTEFAPSNEVFSLEKLCFYCRFATGAHKKTRHKSRNNSVLWLIENDTKHLWTPWSRIKTPTI